MKKNRIRRNILLCTIGIALFACAAAAVGLVRASSIGTVEIILLGIAAAALIFAVVFGVLLSRGVRKQYHWYESLLDSIPFPISVTDIDMNWTFINKPVEAMLGIKREEVLGKQCENWNASICRTENCGVARLRSGQLQTQFEQLGMDFQVDAAYILDEKGRQIGHIEVVQDISSKVKGAAYSAKEVGKLAANLRALAEGNLHLAFDVEPGDSYTENEKKNFEEINTVFKQAVTSIAAYVKEMTYMLDKLSKGDLSEEITTLYRGDFAALKDSINGIVVTLSSVLSEINTAADQVASGTRQVSGGSQAISQGATEQASAIEQLTASIAEIAAQTKQNAVNANRANELSIAAKEDAVSGNEQMKGMQQAMAEINEASENISKIIKVIDDIAFQTNILALNAAVEAARAGIHGKGFAVVAEEVRNLAARSANAAKETTELIEGSIRKAAAGTKIADGTAEALSNIVSGVEKTVQLVGEIAVASNEQATGIAQVNRGIEQLSDVVQTNSATSEETAAASEELSGQADMLKAMVSQFKLKNSAATAKAPASAQPAEKHAHSPKAKGGIALNDSEFGKY